MSSPNHFPERDGELPAEPQDAEFFLTTLDDFAREKFPPEYFRDFYENDVGSIVSNELVPDFVRDRLPLSADSDPGVVVDLYRVFAGGKPAVVDQERRADGIAALYFFRYGPTDNFKVACEVHAAYRDDQLVHWLEVHTGSLGPVIRVTPETCQGRSQEEQILFDAMHSLQRSMDGEIGLSTVSREQLGELLGFMLTLREIEPGWR